MGRLRWWVSGPLAAGVPAAAAVGLLTAVHAWASFPGIRDREVLRSSDFEVAGLAPAAYTLLAFTVAAVAGLVLRNAPAAVVVAFAVLLTVEPALSFEFRARYLPPVEVRFGVAEQTLFVPDDGLSLDRGYLDAAGREISVDPFGTPTARRPRPASRSRCANAQPGSPSSSSAPPLQRSASATPQRPAEDVEVRMATIRTAEGAAPVRAPRGGRCR